MSGPIRAALADLLKIQRFTALILDGRKWLLPQAEIRLLGSLLDIDQEVRAPGSIGAFALEDEWWPVYCLSGELQLLPQLAATRRGNWLQLAGFARCSATALTASAWSATESNRC